MALCGLAAGDGDGARDGRGLAAHAAVSGRERGDETVDSLWTALDALGGTGQPRLSDYLREHHALSPPDELHKTTADDRPRVPPRRRRPVSG